MKQFLLRLNKNKEDENKNKTMSERRHGNRKEGSPRVGRGVVKQTTQICQYSEGTERIPSESQMTSPGTTEKENRSFREHGTRTGEYCTVQNGFTQGTARASSPVIPQATAEVFDRGSIGDKFSLPL